MGKISQNVVKHIASLAKIPTSDKEQKELADGFNKTLDMVDKLFKVDVTNIEPTHQVTGLENVLREDKVNEKKTLTQENALKNTRRKHNGYFVVDQILEDD